MNDATEHEIVPDAFRITARRLSTGTVVLTQANDQGDAIIVIPPQFIRGFVQGVFDVWIERT